MTRVHNKAGCPYYRGKACLLSLGLIQLSVIELCLNSYFEVIVLSLLAQQQQLSCGREKYIIYTVNVCISEVFLLKTGAI